MALQLGDEAPNFTAETTEGTINFHEWIGNSWAVLFSHPEGLHAGLHDRARSRRRRSSREFDKRGVKVLGLSVDPLDDHKRWAGDIKETQGHALNFPLIADPDRKVANLYGMIHPNANDTLTVRSVFVIGPDKKIKLSLTYPASTGPQLRRAAARDRLAAADREAQGRDAGRLEAGRGRDHRAVGVGCRREEACSRTAGRR